MGCKKRWQVRDWEREEGQTERKRGAKRQKKVLGGGLATKSLLFGSCARESRSNDGSPPQTDAGSAFSAKATSKPTHRPQKRPSGCKMKPLRTVGVQTVLVSLRYVRMISSSFLRLGSSSIAWSSGSSGRLSRLFLRTKATHLAFNFLSSSRLSSWNWHSFGLVSNFYTIYEGTSIHQSKLRLVKKPTK